HGRAGGPRLVEGLGGRALVDQVQVHVDQRRLALRLGHDVPFPDLLEKRPAHAAAASRSRRSRTLTTSPITMSAGPATPSAAACSVPSVAMTTCWSGSVARATIAAGVESGTPSPRRRSHTLPTAASPTQT